jgi:four helix bundle protein
MGDFKELSVWKMGRALTRDVYRVTSDFPAEERFGLTAQLRSAAVSIGSNIAEGSAKLSLRDQARHFRIANGSAREVESLLVMAHDSGRLRDADLEGLNLCVRRVQQMLTALISSCERRGR